MATDYAHYSYVSLNEVINNFMLMYTGKDKVLGNTSRTDVLFHARRGMQEFSYDILKTITSIELEVPHTLKLELPPNYVNYTGIFRISSEGFKKPLMPLHKRPTPEEYPEQDENGDNIQDENGLDISKEESESYARTKEASILKTYENASYGMDPYMANGDGYYNIDMFTGDILFTSELVGETILLEYLTDNLSDLTTARIPKMAEEAMYSYILAAIINLKSNIPEYVVKRYQKDRRVKMRNAKIRLSNIKLNELTQVMRNKSKMFKH